ncbi:unnamed protein product [Caenorhabditis auriculariae]|uniref:Potassium channel domain-containing protein n=1 Tax=Caenorhabditis auriculariae TaxID=2777116 RepID=A0A8S1GP10_9PELO|nr:unnamed protein product [Caenorhabditis auriculariae]
MATMNGPKVGYSFVRRRDTIVDENAMQRNYINQLTDNLVGVMMDIHERLSVLNKIYANDTDSLVTRRREFRKYALNKIYKSVYWYTLSTFYLTEHEMHKAMALRPRNPEPLWKHQFESNYGRIKALKNYTDQLCMRCWELVDEGAPGGWTLLNYHLKVNESVLEYNNAVGLGHVLTPVWTFWNAMFLAVTTYTTIGYGNITAKTKLGKLAAMVYAVIGIPLVLMILHKLGRFFLLALENELLLTLMEEYSADPDANRLKSGTIGMKEMWRAWKKRKSRPSEEIPKNARNAAGKAGENLAKMLPFSGRRQRMRLIDELQKKMRRKDKATQTDFGCPACEEEWSNAASDVDSCATFGPEIGACVLSMGELQPPHAIYCSFRMDQYAVRRAVSRSAASAYESYFTSVFCVVCALGTCCELVAYSCRLRSEPKMDVCCNQQGQTDSVISFLSTNWLQTPRGGPRGLIVPYSYMSPSHTVTTTDMNRLISEIDARLQDCRQKMTPQNSVQGSVSGTSFSRAVPPDHQNKE